MLSMRLLMAPISASAESQLAESWASSAARPAAGAARASWARRNRCCWRPACCLGEGTAVIPLCFIRGLPMDGSEWQYGPRLGMPEAGGSLRADGLRAGRAAGGGSEAGSEHHDRGRGEGGSYEWCKAVCGPLVALREASFASVVFGRYLQLYDAVLECTAVSLECTLSYTTTQT